MCLLTTNPKQVVLEEDLITYKELESNSGEDPFMPIGLYSPYFHFLYKEGELYKTKILETDNICAYDSVDTDMRNLIQERGVQKITSFGEGFHSALTPQRIVQTGTGDCLIYMCRIPKGSIVIYGFTNLVVSDQIIIEKHWNG